MEPETAETIVAIVAGLMLIYWAGISPQGNSDKDES